MDLLLLVARRSGRALSITILRGLACGLVVLVAVSRVICDVSLLRLGQGAVHDMRLHLSARLIDTPLPLAELCR